MKPYKIYNYEKLIMDELPDSILIYTETSFSGGRAKIRFIKKLNGKYFTEIIYDTPAGPPSYKRVLNVLNNMNQENLPIYNAASWSYNVDTDKWSRGDNLYVEELGDYNIKDKSNFSIMYPVRYRSKVNFSLEK